MIETARLMIRPSTYDQLLKYVRCDHSLEKELKIQKTERTLSPALKETLEKTILPNVADRSRNYLCTAVDQGENWMVGDTHTKKILNQIRNAKFLLNTHQSRSR